MPVLCVLYDIANLHDTDGITIRDMKTARLWSVVNPLAPRLVTAVYEFTLSSIPVAEASAFAGTTVRE